MQIQKVIIKLVFTNENILGVTELVAGFASLPVIL